jgi:hypothetical protein
MTLRTRHGRALVRAAITVAIGFTVFACNTATSSAPATVGPSPWVQAATPSPTAVATPTALASPSRAALHGDPHAVALVTALSSVPLITHLEQTATAVQGNGTTADVTLSADISGDDMSMRLSTSFAGKTTEQDVVAVGDWAYTRTDGGVWSRSPRAISAAALDGVIKAIRLTDDPADLRYVGVETIDGKQLDHLTASRRIPYPSTGATGQFDAFDVWTEADGTPVLAKTAFSATSNAVKITGTTESHYSKFGGPIEIAAPSVAPSAAP